MTNPTLTPGKSRTSVPPASTTVANPVEHSAKPYQKPPGKKRSDADRKAEEKEKAKSKPSQEYWTSNKLGTTDVQQKHDDKAANRRRMTPSNPPEQENEDQRPQDRVEDTPRSKRPTKATRQGDDFFRQEDVHQNVDEQSAGDDQDPFQAETAAPHHSRTSSQGSEWLHQTQANASDSEGSQCQPSPSPVYVPAAHLEQLMGKLQADLKKDFNDKIAELEKQKQKDRELFQEKERVLNERLEVMRSELQGERDRQERAFGFSGPQEYEELLRLRAESSRRRSELPPDQGRKEANHEHHEEGPQDNEEEMDEDIGLIVPEGSTPLPSTPIDLAACPPFHRTKDIVFEGVDVTKVERYLVCFLGCNALLRDQNTGPNILMGLRRERYDVDTSNMTIAAAAPQLDILAPRETFMGMMHAGNSSNAIRHNDPTNANLHREMMVTALSYSQPIRDAVVHLFRCKQSEVDTCITENIDTLVLRPAQASVKARNVPPTIGYAVYMTPPRNAAATAIAAWVDAVKGIQVEHPKMVLSYHMRRDFKCRICKDISHNDPDCPWPKTNGYLGPKMDTIFGKNDKSRITTMTKGFQRGGVRGRKREPDSLPQHIWMNLLASRAGVLGEQETYMFQIELAIPVRALPLQEAQWTLQSVDVLRIVGD
ncbi:hypothetical protein IW261DRAFT_1429352 [Armillaria novae-zelandiae]|uniref:Uncharacterized protein n=1 Tax=Armillaria novae-zelandiae TaxID=153914 RepID=A0AA39KF15_9AGAR|nr:hypothetical protein IW261DRAFT_1429352 [Armillaria novae-zelandiae]